MAEEVLSHGGKRETYTEFVEKFKPKKTTDDCITPVPVYEAVADWVANEYGLDRDCFVRPFWPGGDYESFEYPEGCVVVDNPPFSLGNKIRAYYVEHGIRFFLFAPALTFANAYRIDGVCMIVTCANITYDNGAKVATSFWTNMEDGYRLRTAPGLYKKLKAIEDERKAANAMPKYTYPDYIVTAAMATKFTKYGIEYNVRTEDSVLVNKMDAQKAIGHCGVYGGGLLLSEKAAAEKAAAEKAAAEKRDAIVWALSDREREIIKNLGKGDA